MAKPIEQNPIEIEIYKDFYTRAIKELYQKRAGCDMTIAILNRRNILTPSKDIADQLAIETNAKREIDTALDVLKGLLENLK
jgi:hypothetical protein